MTPTSPFRKLPHPRGTARVAGFTLLEILLVLTLIALASIVLLPNVTELGSRGFDVKVRQAATLLNHARREAVVLGMARSATFYSGPGQDKLPDAPRNSVGQWRSEDIKLSYLSSADRESDVDEMLAISFYPEGGSTGGTLLLSQADRRAQIHVDPFTGRINVEDEQE